MLIASLDAAYKGSQDGKPGRGRYSKYLPMAFTEHGAIMAATLLGSPRATEISVHVVRAFVQWRSMLATNRALPSKLHTLERARTAYVHHTALATAPQPAGLSMA